MATIILSIIAISTVPLVGAWYARTFQRKDGLVALYVVFAAMSQIMAAKIALFDFYFFNFTAPAAVVVFAVTFLMTDIVNEKFGQRAVHEMILITFATQIAMTLFLWIGGALPPAPFWQNQSAWDSFLGVVPRITFASWLTFLVSENLDAWLFASLRRLTKGRHLWLRNVFSSIPALTIDTLVFVPLAFYGSGIPLWPIIMGQFALKYVVGIINIPFMYLNRWVAGERIESIDSQGQT